MIRLAFGLISLLTTNCTTQKQHDLFPASPHSSRVETSHLVKTIAFVPSLLTNTAIGTRALQPPTSSPQSQSVIRKSPELHHRIAPTTIIPSQPTSHSHNYPKTSNAQNRKDGHGQPNRREPRPHQAERPRQARTAAIRHEREPES